MTDQVGPVALPLSGGGPEDGPGHEGHQDPDGLDPEMGPPAERTAARLTVHGMMEAVQWGLAPPLAIIAGVVESGDINRWYEVSVIGRCAAALVVEAGRTWPGGGHIGQVRRADATGSSDDASDERVEDMRRRAESARDPALLAMALAFRSAFLLRRARREGRTIAGPEADLAGAVVLLERGDGGALERIGAHTACGVAFSMMAAWELALRQYEAAASIDPVALEPHLAGDDEAVGAPARALVYSLVEMHVNQACARRVAGDLVGSLSSAQAAIDQLEAVQASPAGWASSRLVELESCGLLARALGGEDVSAQAADALATDDEPRVPPPLLSMRGGFELDAMRAGNASLALALSLTSNGSDAAREVAEAAVSTLRTSPPALLDLAMDLAARVEGAPAAARLARAQTELLWNGRRRTVDSMEALIRTERLRSRSEELERHAHIDELTGLANRRGFYRYLNELLVERRTRVSLLVVDIDRFKDVNDRYGHPIGDHALRRLAGVLSRLVRPLDLAARLGGDEFFLLLEGTGVQVAIERAETIVRTIGEPGPDEHDLPLSVTIGVASGPPAEFDRLLAEADGALYRGKSTGGGRWVSSSPPAASNL
jgi:diguanylate cyclase (GGDEF)-like protein